MVVVGDGVVIIVYFTRLIKRLYEYNKIDQTGVLPYLPATPSFARSSYPRPLSGPGPAARKPPPPTRYAEKILLPPTIAVWVEGGGKGLICRYRKCKYDEML